MKRRNFLASVSAGAVPGFLFGCVPNPSRTERQEAAVAANETSSNVTNKRTLQEFGLQLSTLTPLLMADFEGTLQKVAAIGYRQVGKACT